MTEERARANVRRAPRRRTGCGHCGDDWDFHELDPKTGRRPCYNIDMLGVDCHCPDWVEP